MYQYTQFLSGKLFPLALSLLLLTSCATQPKLDANSIAEIVGKRANLGTAIRSHKCSFIQANIGSVSAPMQEGICIAYDKSFVYRAVDINNSTDGRSVIFDYRGMKYVGLTEPRLLGVKQLQFTTNTYVNSVIFRPDHGMWYDNDTAEEFLQILLSKGVSEITNPKPLDPDVDTSNMIFFMPIPSK